jgi:hypothetical protein
LIANQPHISDLSQLCLVEKHVDLLLVRVKVDPAHQHSTVVSLSLFSLSLGLLKVLRKLLLLLALLFFLVDASRSV